jgi:16S rRNA (adenine1518-N6/adenine1519-N6)-dimethyltransferase
MQTKQQIKSLLDSAGVKPNKRLGQHFLIDLNLMRLLVDSANIRSSDVILEVGCGTGSLTEELAQRSGRVVAVEMDGTLAQIAQEQLAEAAPPRRVKIIIADVLESKNDINHDVATALRVGRKKFHGRVMLVANLPYNAAAAVMANLIVGPVTVEAMYVTVQREVAQRMAAVPGCEDYGVLSILMAAAGEVKTIRLLSPSVFWPRPQVDSAMVSFHRMNERLNRIHDIKLFRRVVNLFMGHRRKMLKACTKLADGRLALVENWPDIFERAFVDPARRPDELSAEEFIAIANNCYELLH